MILAEFLDLFQDHSEDELNFGLQNLVNILLVYLHGRTACIIETCHIGFEPTIMEFLSDYVDRLGCVMEMDLLSNKKYPRYLITKHPLVELPKTEEEMGALLDMTYLCADYSDFRIRRHYFTIHAEIQHFSFSVFTEVTRDPEKTRKNIERLIQSWQTIMKNHPISELDTLHFDYTEGIDEGLKYRMEKIIVPEYFKEHFEEYYNDVLNFSGRTIDRDDYETSKKIYFEIVQPFFA